MFRLPVRLPAAAGVKVTLMEQLAAAGTLPRQLLVSAKSEAFVPLIEMLVMVSAVDLLFVNVTVWDALVVPGGWFENDRFVGKTPTGTYNSALASEEKLLSLPPATRTIPLFSNVAV
jgi:hypothetical protein